MNFDEAAKYIANKNLKHDLDIVDKASKKWTGKKQVNIKTLSELSVDIKTGQDLLTVLKEGRVMLDLQKELLTKILPKNFNDIISHLNTIISKNDSDIIETEMNNARSGCEAFAKRVDLRTNEQFLKGGYTHYFPENEESYGLELGTIQLHEFRGEYHRTSSLSIVFDKTSIPSLIKEIEQYIGLDLKTSSNSIQKQLVTDVKRFQLSVNRLIAEYSHSTDSKPEIQALLNKFSNDFDTDEDFWDFVFGDFYKLHLLPYDNNWRVFIMIIQRIIEAIEKTDSWLSSKNV